MNEVSAVRNLENPKAPLYSFSPSRIVYSNPLDFTCIDMPAIKRMWLEILNNNSEGLVLCDDVRGWLNGDHSKMGHVLGLQSALVPTDNPYLENLHSVFNGLLNADVLASWCSIDDYLCDFTDNKQLASNILTNLYARHCLSVIPQVRH